jgi:hypothetical protein
MGVCSATKANGEPCTLPAIGKHGYCWAHNPATTEQRRKRASKGGKGKAAKKVSVLWDEVRAVISKVEEGSLTPPQGNTMIRGYNTLIELAKLDIEQGELEISQRRLELDEEERTTLREDVEALKAAEERRSPWGA